MVNGRLDVFLLNLFLIHIMSDYQTRPALPFPTPFQCEHRNHEIYLGRNHKHSSKFGRVQLLLMSLRSLSITNKSNWTSHSYNIYDFHLLLEGKFLLAHCPNEYQKSSRVLKRKKRKQISQPLLTLNGSWAWAQ